MLIENVFNYYEEELIELDGLDVLGFIVKPRYVNDKLNLLIIIISRHNFRPTNIYYGYSVQDIYLNESLELNRDTILNKVKELCIYSDEYTDNGYSVSSDETDTLVSDLMDDFNDLDIYVVTKIFNKNRR